MTAPVAITLLVLPLVVDKESGCNTRRLITVYFAEHRIGNCKAEKKQDGPVVLDIQLMCAALVIVQAAVELPIGGFLLHRAEDVTARRVISHDNIHDAVLFRFQTVEVVGPWLLRRSD